MTTIIPQISDKLREMLTEKAKIAAEATNLVIRKGNKVTGPNLAQTLIFAWWEQPDRSLESICQMGRVVGLDISPQGLDQRWNRKTADFLLHLMQEVVKQKLQGEEAPSELLRRFSEILIDDSTVVSFPQELVDIWLGCGGSAATSAAKLQTRIDMKCGALDGPHLVDGRVHDQQAAQQHADPELGSLRIVDLGYWKLDSWENAAQTDHYLLSRLKTGTCFYFEDSLWAIETWCDHITEDQFEVIIQLGKKHRVECRLMGMRVPQKVAEQRRRVLKRASQKRGQTVSKARLALCDWTIFVTNVPSEKLSFSEGLTLLRYRWQIELLFKLWKSHGQIDKSRSQNPWRRLCEFYAKLIAMILQQWIFAATNWRFIDRSCTKAAATIRSHIIALAHSFHDSDTLVHSLETLRNVLSRGCRINRSRKQQRAFQLLLASETIA